LHDLIQPSFSFLVGVALPFSLARRASEGQPAWRRTLHAFWRAAVLVLLGVFLRSIGHKQTYWTFEDTLSQIGLGYGFLYLLANRSTIVQWSALAVILVGYWAAFAAYPLPSSDFNWKAAGVDPADTQTHLAGFDEHWSKNTNLAWAFDTWFLNLFPRSPEFPGGGATFTGNPGGYVTLSFIPTLGTMTLGLLAGGVLASGRAGWAKIRWLAIAGILCLAAGWLCGALGICPVVKRIWTPSWVLYSGGWCFLLLAGFYAVMDIWRWRRWAFALVVIGMNSIAAYMIAHLFPGFIRTALPRHFGSSVFESLGPAYEHFVLGVGILIVEWLILFWMYRRKIFLRI
jgi:predicted acyltransferase